MATTQTQVRARAARTSRHSRSNEIAAILLLALSVLLSLCLATYDPNDPSWNSAGQTIVHNWIGPLGANVSAALLQAIGFAAYLLPLLLLGIAWRLLKRGPLRAPLSRVAGILTLVLAASALLTLSGMPPRFDSSFHPGGLTGTIVASALASFLNTTGAMVILVAAAATGLLLATNFSFVRAYEGIAGLFENRFTFFRTLPARFHVWREARRERARARAEERAAARAERMAARAEHEARREAERKLRDKSGAERVAEFMREQETAAESAAPLRFETAAPPIVREAAAAPPAPVPEKSPLTAFEAQAEAFRLATLEPPETVASLEPAVVAERAPLESGAAPLPDDAAAAAPVEVQEMLKSASVVRVDEEEAGERPVRARPRRAALAVSPDYDYKLPNVAYLNEPTARNEQADEELHDLARRLAEKCTEFNVHGKIMHICPGPVVTTFEFKPDPGVKYSRVTGLVDDLCLALKAESIRIDRMPGKSHVGIEVPNPHRETIHLREVIESRPFRESASKLTIALGKTIDGLNYVADLARMPHLLIAGATGTGKSVAVNSLVVSILYRARPEEVKFIMVDPKRLELGLYADVPHLATPIITDPKRAAISLKWAVSEMERRYRELAGWGVRNIDGFNVEVERRNREGEFDETTGAEWKPLPYIVIIIDELADLMMVSGHEVEESITRLAQMARAVGIHLVLATQRPSVDVITGLIKANFPSRISFRVSSKVDSRTIIDSNGAEQLLGRGDMLFLPPGTSRLVRVHGAYVDENEIGRIVKHVKEQGRPAYDESITQTEDEATSDDGMSQEHDELFADALRICVEMKRASTSVLQRRLRIGYGRAAAILDMMEREGLIGQADGARPRPVLGPAYERLAQIDSVEEAEI